jgi:hypothetical protein
MLIWLAFPVEHCMPDEHLPACGGSATYSGLIRCSEDLLGDSGLRVLQVRQGLLVGFAVLLPLIGLVCLPAVFVMHMTPVRSAHSVRIAMGTTWGGLYLRTQRLTSHAGCARIHPRAVRSCVYQ